MSTVYIKYMTPTKEEAVRIARLAKRIHGEDLPRCIMVGSLPDNEKIFREPDHGRPRERVYYTIGTRNCELAMDSRAWNTAIRLYHTKPYWIAWILSWKERWAK